MARGKCAFTQTDVARAIRAARAAGVEGAKVEIDPETGKIVIALGDNEATAKRDDDTTKEIIL